VGAPAANANGIGPANVIAGVGGPDPNLFSLASYNHDAGTVASMTWAAGGSHNVTASAKGPDGNSLFRSATIGSGSTSVSGTQYLAIGAYPFVCTIHAGMSSSLNVNTGTPLARPTVAVKLASKGLAKVVAKAKASVKVTLTGGQTATVTLKLGKKSLGSKTTAKSGTLAVPLTAKGRKALEGKTKAKLKVEASVDFGSPAKASGTLK
jgi:plastocyanin